MDLNRGWETSSDEDNGMEIDLEAKEDEGKRNRQDEAAQVEKLDYDPAEPTDDYDPSEPTADPESSEDVASEIQQAGLVANYDPAEPTLSEEEEEETKNALVTDDAQGNEAQLDEPEHETDERLPSEDIFPTQDTESKEETQTCIDEPGDESEKEDHGSSEVYNTNADAEQHDGGIASGQNMAEDNLSRSPSLHPTDTEDENTQMSFADGNNSDVPEVTFDESDFVLEKELLEPSEDQRDDEPPSWQKSAEVDKEEQHIGETLEEGNSVHSDLSPEPSTLSATQEAEQSERSRTQEEVDSRNEEVLVDLFREESDPDRIENDLEQPQKKTKKKIGTKKLKKKGKKLKKGLGKKGQDKFDSHAIEDQRFVELRGDRHSIESREEGELEAGRPVELGSSNWEDVEDRLAPEHLYDVSTVGLSEGGDDGEQREPGEIIEESSKRKSGKKRDREKKRRKKSRREVATIEEGIQGDEDSQKFPSFLAGFFVQDEEGGDEDIAEKIDSISHSLEVDEDRTFQKGGKTYRKHHDSGAEDSVKSLEEGIDHVIDQDLCGEEGLEHRRHKPQDERRHSSREHRHHDGRELRETRREREHRHDASRERVRDRERSRHDRDRPRERENRDRDRERERSRRGDREERRRRHASRSASRERRRRSGSAERNRRSRSRERALRHRRHRSRTPDRERERDRERSRRSQRERSRDRDNERRVRGASSGRRASHSRSRSPRHRSERGSSNKENRDETQRSSRRRVISRNQQEESESEDREVRRSSHHRHQRRERDRDRERERERGRSSSSSSSSSSSTSSTNGSRSSDHGGTGSARRHRRHHQHREQQQPEHGLTSSDEGASSDVILVEPEKIIINLDEEEDPPSRVDITHANAEDDSTTVVDGESIPPPPDLGHNARSSALIQITQEPSSQQEEEGAEHEEGDATPTRDERSDEANQVPERTKQSAPRPEAAAEVGDYDPAHPTDEQEERDSRPHSPAAAPTVTSAPPPPVPQSETEDAGPVPPSHPPPQEIRPSPPPPVPVMPEPTLPPPVLSEVGPRGIRPQLQMSRLQGPPSLMQGQRLPPAYMPNGPAGPGMPNFPNNQRGLLPTPDTQPLFRRDQQMGPNQPPVPISAMAPLAQLTSLLPALERAKLASHQSNSGPPQSMFKPQSFGMVSNTNSTVKGPLMSSSGSNIRPPFGIRGGGGDHSESTEVVDMDMSPGEDDCELELPSPHSSDSDDRRRRGRKSDSRTKGGVSSGNQQGPIQPAVYLKALSKAIERLTPKGQPLASGGSAAQDKSKQHERRKRRQQQQEAVAAAAAEDDVPTSAVELTNKEKYLKKLHLQERVIDEVKLAIKPFYSSKKINKEQYKLILRKAVPKVCHSKSERINPQKIQQLVEAYVGKLGKGGGKGGGHGGGHGGRKRKSGAGQQAKDSQAGAAAVTAGAGQGQGQAPVARQNGERAKKSNR